MDYFKSYRPQNLIIQKISILEKLWHTSYFGHISDVCLATLTTFFDIGDTIQIFQKHFISKK